MIARELSIPRLLKTEHKARGASAAVVRPRPRFDDLINIELDGTGVEAMRTVRSTERKGHGAYGRRVHYRSQLVIRAMVGAVVAPIPAAIAVGIMRSSHVGCDFVAESGSIDTWICPDGIGNVLPFLTLWVLFALLIFWVSIAVVVHRIPESRSAIARDLAFWGAVPMAAGGVLGVGFTLSGAGTGLADPALTDVWTAAAQSLAVAISAGLVVWTSRRGGSGLALWCLVAAAAGAASLMRAALVTPILAVCIGMLLPAAVLTLTAKTGSRALTEDATR